MKTHQPTQVEFITIDEAARIARVSKRTVNSWIASRAVSAVRLGRVVRLDRALFHAELRRFTVPAVA